MGLTDTLAGLRVPVGGPALSVVLGTVVLLVLWRIFTPQLDPKEPPLYRAGIPVIGHIVGLLRYSDGYWPKLYKEYPMPICTLPTLQGKIYLINSPDLISAAFKARTLGFDPNLLKTIKYTVPISNAAMEAFMKNDFLDPWTKMLHDKLSGADLRQTSAAGLTDILHTLNHLPQNMEVQDTWTWLRSVLTVATTSALLGAGPRNPWRRSRALVPKLWEYDAGLRHFVAAGPPAWITASGAYRARADLHAALTEYCGAGVKDDEEEEDGASALVAALAAATGPQKGRQAGWAAADQAALLLAVVRAAVAETVPTGFWLLAHVLADARLAARLRAEAAPLASKGARTPDGGRHREVGLDLRGLRDESHCPLLAATLRETRRLVGAGVVRRWVREDTTLDGEGPGAGRGGQRSYLLRAGTPVQVSGLVAHGDAARWGSSVDAFDPDRFLRPGKAGGGATPRGTIVPVGSNEHLFPGRDLAATELLGMLVVLLLGFDITTPEGKPPTVPGRRMPLPMHDVGHPVAGDNLELSIRRRKGWEDVVWKVAD